MNVTKQLASTVLCLFAVYIAVAQTNNLHQLSGADELYERLELLTNFARDHNITLQEALTNKEYQTNAFFQLHGVSESEYKSNLINAMLRADLRKPWPEPSKRQAIFEHCAAVLRSAINTNQIEAACGKLTNEVEAATLTKLAKQAMTNLDTFANLLSSPNLNSFLGAGYRAKISTPTNSFSFSFWPGNGAAGIVVRDLEKRTSDSKHVLVSARFSESGKLIIFSVTDEMQLVFNEDGTLQSHWSAAVKTKQ
jgi:hypothetical protein